MPITNFPNGLSSFGVPVIGAGLDMGQAGAFFVEANRGNDINDGTSWDSAFKTVAKGLAACHTFQAKASYGAQRSKLFIAGEFTEDLTALASATDVVGVGQTDGILPACIKGNNVIAAVAYKGCRFYNVAFKDNDATGTIITLVTQQVGTVFENCFIVAGTATVVGILATASADLAIRGTRFLGSYGTANGFTGAAISLGAGAAPRTVIENNLIESYHATGKGILVNASRTGNGSFIRNNHIVSKALAIDDDSDTFNVIDNRIIVATNKAAGTSVDLNVALASNNIVTGTDGTIAIPACNFGAQS